MDHTVDNLRFIVLLLGGLAFCSGVWGFCLLKIYDLFRQAIRKQNRFQIWLACSGAILTVLIMIVGGAGLGIALQQYQFESIRLSIPHKT